MLSDQTISITDLRTQTAEIIKSLRGLKYVFVNNKPKSVLMDIEYFEKIQHQLAQQNFLSDVNEAEKTGPRFENVESLMTDLFDQ